MLHPPTGSLGSPCIPFFRHLSPLQSPHRLLFYNPPRLPRHVWIASKNRLATSPVPSGTGGREGCTRTRPGPSASAAFITGCREGLCPRLRLTAPHAASAPCAMKGLAISSAPAVGATTVTDVPRHTTRPRDRVSPVRRSGSSASAAARPEGNQVQPVSQRGRLCHAQPTPPSTPV